MDRPRRNDKLGVNKTGKSIQKGSLHQPNFSNGILSSRPQSRPLQHIRNNDFRSIVQQLKGSPLRESLLPPPPPPPPPQNPLKSKNTQFQKIRQAAVTQLYQAHVSPPPVLGPLTHDLAARSQMQPLIHGSQSMMGHGDQVWSGAAESSVSVHNIRDLQSSPSGNQMQPSPEHQRQPQMQGQAQLHSPLFNSCASTVPILPTPPRFNGPPQQMYTNSLSSSRFNGRGILPSPTTYRDLLSPRSPYPLLSPGVGYPRPPFKPRGFTSSTEPGILGPGIIPQPSASTGIVFPSSQSRVFPNL